MGRSIDGKRIARTLIEEAREGGFYLEHHKPRNLFNTQPSARPHTAWRRTTTRALSDLKITRADGSMTIKHTRGRVTEYGKPIRVRHRYLRGTISDYVAVAERAGLNVDSIVAAYRDRRDQGYGYGEGTVDVQTNASFRGGDQ